MLSPAPASCAPPECPQVHRSACAWARAAKAGSQASGGAPCSVRYALVSRRTPVLGPGQPSPAGNEWGSVGCGGGRGGGGGGGEGAAAGGQEAGGTSHLFQL